MCVLYGCTSDVPDREILELNGHANDDGGGVAWIGDDGRVHWKKGIKTPAALWNAAKNLPLPIIVHQRMRSAGPAIPALTHPFPLTKRAGVDLQGTARAVLAHNGTIANWQEILTAARKRGYDVPTGPMSDTRLLAWAVAQAGDKALEKMAKRQKVAILSVRDGLRIINPGFWRFRPSDTGGYWQSSDYSWSHPSRRVAASNLFGDEDDSEADGEMLV